MVLGKILGNAVGKLASKSFSKNNSGSSASFDFEAERSARREPGYWQTQKAALLDNEEVLNKLIDAMGSDAHLKQVEDSGDSREKLQDDIIELLFAELKDERGVHAETALTAIGALAGFAVQMTIWEFMIKPGRVPKEQALVEAKTKNDEIYYFGNLLNEGLAEPQKGNLSVWGFVAAAPHHLGKPIPEIKEIFAKASSQVGSKEFHIPNLPSNHMPMMMPDQLLWKFWGIVRTMMVTGKQDASMWGFFLGQTAQKMIFKLQEVIDPTLAARIVMEAAIPMSKVDPNCVEYAYFQKYD